MDFASMGLTGGITGRSTVTSMALLRPATSEDGAMPTTEPVRDRSREPVAKGQGSARALAAVLAVAGVTHFVAPAAYERLIPSFLGGPRPWILGSGVLELVCAAGVAVPRSRRIAAAASAGLFVVVFPGNLTMALDSAGYSGLYRTVAFARLPLQVPLVLWALSVARRPDAAERGRSPVSG
jgi:uncharacterized membrane protein